MPYSLNFRFDSAPSSVDALGASAEALLFTTPDLALLRVRQLLEVFVAHVRSQDATADNFEEGGSLGPVIGSLLPNHLRAVTQHELRLIARACNAAVHHNTTRRRDGASYARAAREQLAAVHGVWARWLGVQRTFQLPAPGGAEAQQLAALHVALDRIERRVDVGRDFSALADLGLLPAPPQGIGPKDHDLLDLRVLSIRRAGDNHAGREAGPLDPLAERLLRYGDGQAQEEALHYLNRTAVGHLNDLACDDALAVVSEYIEWRQAVATFLPKRVSDLGVSDRTLGALLGSGAQAMAMNAFADRSTEQSDQALATFREAKLCFIEAEDLDRQDTYRAHALIDRVRIGGALSAEERAWLERRVAGAPVGALPGSDTGAPFRVALALKAHFLLDVPYAVERVAQALSPALTTLLARDGLLPHPYENIAGWLLQTRCCPRDVRSALEGTAEEAPRKGAAVLGWIAQVFLDHAAGRPASVAPGRLKRWSERVVDRPALDALPFNYA